MTTWKLPATVRVGYQTVTVKKVDPADLSYTHMGSYQGSTGRISVCRDLGTIQGLNTFIHELLHAVFYTQGLGCEANEEERIVNALANGLVQMIRDNPELLSYLAALAYARED